MTLVRVTQILKSGEVVEYEREVDEDELNLAEYIWCLHCECAYARSAFEEADWVACPTDTCDGSMLDWNSWARGRWPRILHPEYPDVPIEGKYYPLYGRGK